MKVVILAGRYGTRISEESQFKPKPMIDIAGDPILWHIMKSYSYYGHNEFIICAGYKQQVIKEFFAHYGLYCADVTFDLSKPNAKQFENSVAEPWVVTVANTGLNTMTGGRVKRVKDYIGDEPFLLTYGDGVCDVDINQVISHHKRNGKIATLTAVQPGGRFGNLEFDEDSNITSFAEKRKEDGGWINGGFMVLSPEIIDRIEGDNSVLERDVLESLAKEGQLTAYKYTGFWQCMDTLRDKQYLESLILKNNAPWVKWED
jgi:glucose-1-phosphate cytidylyltransferase